MFEEAHNRAYGHSAAVDGLLQYTLVIVIRHFLENNMMQCSLLNAMADSKLSAVLEALHAAGHSLSSGSPRPMHGRRGSAR